MAVVCWKTVWLVDDDELSNYVNGVILKIQNFAQSIVTFTSVKEALISLDLAIKGDEAFPDIIFLDMEMPVLNGWDFLDSFHLLPPTVKERCHIYMISSSINEADALKASQYKEVCRFLVKPLSKELLKSIKSPDL